MNIINPVSCSSDDNVIQSERSVPSQIPASESKPGASVDNRTNATGLLQAATVALKTFQVPPQVSDDTIPTALVQAAKKYLEGKDIEEVQVHKHYGREAISMKVPAGQNAQDFLSSLPIFAATNIGGKKEIRVYENFHDLRTEVPDNSKTSLVNWLTLATLNMKSVGKFPENTSNSIKKIIESYISEHGPIPKEHLEYVEYTARLIDEALATHCGDPNLIGSLAEEDYYIRPVSLGEEYEKGLAAEDNFVTLYFQSGEETAGLKLRTCDGIPVYALPKSVFTQALAAGDTSSAFQNKSN